MITRRYPGSGDIPEGVSIGSIFYSAGSYTDEDGKIEIDVNEHHVRSIRRKRRKKVFGFNSFETKNTSPKMLNTIKKDSGSWGKLSKKHFDYGWFKYIPGHYRNSAPIDEGKLPSGMFETKLEALEDLLAVQENTIERWADDQEVQEEISKENSRIKSRITRLKKKTK